MQLVAKTYQGLEMLLADEIRDLGGENIKVLKRAVTYEGDEALLYASNYRLRSALRVLVPLFQFEATNENILYRELRHYDWSQHLTVADTFAVDAITNSPFFTHSHYVALKTKDAIVDFFRHLKGDRPSIDTRYPNVKINIHIGDKLVSVSLDSSGDSLHLRGYKKAKVIAPLSEVMAASLVMLTGWHGEQPLLDPFCGSGTILTEAAMIALRIPCQVHRKLFGFMNWHTFNQALWQQTMRHARAAAHKELHLTLHGYDNNAMAIQAAQQNIQHAGLSDYIKVQRMGFERLPVPFEKGIIITNPPYDERLQHELNSALYNEIGRRLKHDFIGYEAWLLSGYMAGIKEIGLRPSRKLPLLNGNIECKYLKYELYAGTKKAPASANQNANQDE